MLTKEEIIQFHQHGRVTREGLLLGKIPFVVKTLTIGDDLAFASSLRAIKPTDSEEHIANFVAQKTLQRCLLSFNGQMIRSEDVDRFLPPKVNLMLSEWRKLTKDLNEYLRGFSEKELDPEEVEEFILTDQISRGETLHGEEGSPPIRFEFVVLSIDDHTKHHESMRDLLEEGVPKMYFEAESQRRYAARIIKTINGIEINEDNILDFNVELVGFIVERALSIERQMIKLLSSPKDMGDAIKKS